MRIGDDGIKELQALARAADVADHAQPGLELFRNASRKWSSSDPKWSGVGADCSPYEFSIACNGDEVEVRALVEAQSTKASLPGYWEAAQELNAVLENSPGVSTEHWRKIEKYFTPRTTDTFAALWHGIRLTRSGCSFRLYVPPLANGAENAPATVANVLEALGLGSRWKVISRFLEMRAVIGLFAIDLTSALRAKVYLAWPDATIRDLQDFLSACSMPNTEDASLFCRTMLQQDGPYTASPIRACLTIAPAVHALDTPVLDIPIENYLADDVQIHERLLYLFDRLRQSSHGYRRCAAVIDEMWPQRARGQRVSVVSLQRVGTVPRVSVYYSPRIYRSTGCLDEINKVRLWQEWIG